MFKCDICGKELPTSSGLKTHRRYCVKIPSWIREIDDDGKMRRRYMNKCVAAKKEGLLCDLTFEQYCLLVKESGLISSQLGFTGDMYVLARYNDEGNYVYGNCRFIKQIDNAREKKLSDKSVESSRRNAANMNKHNQENYDTWVAAIRRGMQNSEYYNQKRKKAQENKALKDACKDQRYCKEYNSQYGTYWITDGVANRKWSDDKGAIPHGFRKGRVCK